MDVLHAKMPATLPGIRLSAKATSVAFLILALAFGLLSPSLVSPSLAQTAPDPGYITAKTWSDQISSSPAYHTSAVGDGVHDDWQNLQDIITYAIANNEAIKLEPGHYKISKTLMIENPPLGFHFGFRMSGITGPNAEPTPYYNSGVTLHLVTSDASQQAVLEVGAGGFYDITIENIGLNSSVTNQPKSTAPYGLLFAGQNFSHAKIDMLDVESVQTAFGIDGIFPGGNGEAVNIENCRVHLADCFYYNNSPRGQALAHSISKCSFYINNGGTAIKTGPNAPGLSLDVTSLSGTFGQAQSGPQLRNTMIECLGPPSAYNVTGGRVEHCDTLLRYAGGSLTQIGHVVIRGLDFDGMSIYNTSTDPNNPTYVPKDPSYPLIDDTENGVYANSAVNAQYTITVEQCRLNGNYKSLFPALSLGFITNGGDNSRTYFDRCTFTGFSNDLTQLGNSSLHPMPNLDPSQDPLVQLGIRIRDCRSATGTTGGSALTDISYP